MSALKKLKALSQNRRCTHLGIGPMSETTVVAVAELASNLRLPIMLVASRRQIECEDLGGGYVNGWTTRTFAEFVRKHDPAGYVILCRDHGGPWQGYHEVQKKMNWSDAMASAKHSFEEDIKAGFQILHIDPSVGLEKAPTSQETVAWLKELFQFCHSKAQELKKEVSFEFGKEEQGAEVEGNEAAFSEFLEEMVAFAKKDNMPLPLFVVGQTGTKVLERRNVGNFENHFRKAGEIPPQIQVPKLVDACNRYGVWLKAHNVDYLTDEGVRWHAQLGIHAANIAPEFGVGETLQILAICKEFGFKQETEEFLSLAYESRKWEKWMMPNSTATDTEKAIISGHYVFSTPSFRELKERLKEKCLPHNIDLDQCLKEKLKQLIYRYLFNFNLVQS